MSDVYFILVLIGLVGVGLTLLKLIDMYDKYTGVEVGNDGKR